MLAFYSHAYVYTHHIYYTHPHTLHPISFSFSSSTYLVPFVPGVHASGPLGTPMGAGCGGAGGSGPEGTPEVAPFSGRLSSVESWYLWREGNEVRQCCRVRPATAAMTYKGEDLASSSRLRHVPADLRGGVVRPGLAAILALTRGAAGIRGGNP